MFTQNTLFDLAVELLQRLIATPSYSREEQDTATILSGFLEEHGITGRREGNNVFARNLHYAEGKPTLLLNSHHDTVKPNHAYTRDPFSPSIDDGKLYGLGSNDAGGCLVSLIATFLHFYDQPDLSCNILLVASAEEEISGSQGIERVLPLLGNVDCAVVGEPTKMDMAVAERGLMVLDCSAHGVAGHAARNEGENALYVALDDIETIRNFRFDKVSPLLGDTRMSVTVIETDNKQHNVVPSICRFVTDVRVNELYSFEEILQLLSGKVKSAIAPRSTRLRSTYIPLDHPLVLAGTALGRSHYGSPTTSDKALMPFPALKMGPGDSARSHMADEYIFLDEINHGIELYCQMVRQYSELITTVKAETL